MFGGILRFRSVAIGSALLIGLSTPMFADPPTRVARISYVTGPVSFRPAEYDQWAAASQNYPVTIGDHIWTDRAGRAELEFGSVFVRLAPNTEFSVLNLDDEFTQLRLTQGTTTVRVRDFEREGIEVDTPNGAITLEEPGFYRIDVDESGTSTTVTTRSGRADVHVGDRSYAIYPRQSSVFDNRSEPYAIPGGRGADDFEDWSLARDRRVESSVSARYVAPGIIGYADLDEFGVWRNAPGYGDAWFPRVQAGWVPYRYGHWTWIDPWGWNWIDDQPWGFAPSHYGRWAHVRDGWCWLPGERRVRAVYSPAFVTFVGGSGWQSSFGYGAAPVAWFPVGPREPWVPWYGASPKYLRAVNAPHVDVRGNVDVGRYRYVNRDVPGAVTAVPRDAFVRAQPIGRAAVAVPRDAFRDARPTGEAPGRPTRGDAGRVEQPGAAPPSAAIDRSVVVRRPPPDNARGRFSSAPPTPPRAMPVAPTQPEQSATQELAPRVREPQRVLEQPRPVTPRVQVPEREAPQRAEPPPPVSQERVRPERQQPERIPPQERPRVDRPTPAPQERPRAERPAPPPPPPPPQEQKKVERAPQQRQEPRAEQPKAQEQPKQAEQTKQQDSGRGHARTRDR